MKQRLELSIIYFFVLGSVSISSMGFVSQTVQSVFFGIGMSVLFVIGIMNIYKYIQKTSASK
ncbi:hypothetical protein QWY15_11665 [Planococcus sp. N064]|uniref:Uncharacterized protein n=1 Tax=Planococcus liqunii TaxID=3058394 RepID=A0ABT8MSX7_9BACL|nr:hypothetical protein [Planococcus sp. N064]MDN7227956.1 hypothetical protein [Planococcus sp. N064]